VFDQLTRLNDEGQVSVQVGEGFQAALETLFADE
jgi:hypothetical protein